MTTRLTVTYLSILTLFFSSLAGTVSGKGDERLDFVENRRQWPDQVKYKADVNGGSVFFTGKGFMYSYYSLGDLERIHELKHKKADVYNEPVRCHAYEVSFVGASDHIAVTAADKQSHYHNYFLGNDRSRWAGHVPVYRRVQYSGIYNGIDAQIYSQGVSLKYDFVVAPGSDPSVIALHFNGVKPVLTAQGEILLKTSVNTVTEQAPVAFQIINGVRREVACSYRIDAAGNVGFAFPQGYDKNAELVIDPVLVFGTYSGGTGNTYGFSATYDAAGSLYAGGECFNPGWPTTVGAFQVAINGTSIDAGLNKYSSSGSNLVYSTYYGGGGTDLPNNMVVNDKGQLIVCGTTTSTDLPVTTGCFDDTANGSTDIFVARFSADGSALLAATYLGGSSGDGSNDLTLSPNYGDQNRGEVYVDHSGFIYISSSTRSNDFPVTAGAYQTVFGGAQDACIVKLDSGCTTLQFSTYLGGALRDAAFALVPKSNGSVVVVGGTLSVDFPTTAGAMQTANAGSTEAFTSILSADGSTLLRSTYMGTAAYDHAFKVQLDPSENVYVCGQTEGAYPVSTGVYSMVDGSIFIDVLTPDLSASIRSTRLGNPVPPGSFNTKLVPTAFLYDICGNVYLCGFQAAGGLPVSPAAIQAGQGGFWLCVLTSNMSSLAYATYYGAPGDHVDGGTSRFDPQGVVYHSVCNFTNFPTSPTAWQPNDVTNSYDVASFKINFEAMGVIAGIGLAPSSNDSACAPATIQFSNTSVSGTSYTWDFGDNTGTSNLANPSHTYTVPGTYTVTLHAQNPSLCVTDDTTYMTIHIFSVEQPQLALRDTVVCEPGQITLTAPVANYKPNMGFRWEPAAAIMSNPNQQTVTVDGTIANTFTVTVTDSIKGICKESASGNIRMQVFDASQFKADGDTIICPGDVAMLTAEGGDFYKWSPNHKISNLTTPQVTVNPSTTTTYTVTISNTLGCILDKKVTVTVKPIINPDAGEDQDMKFGDYVYLHASGGAQYRWYPVVNLAPPDQPIVKVNPDKTTTYYVEITSAEGCKATDSVTVHVMNLYFPTAFSPNNDGRNDEFKVFISNPNVKLLNMSVYDRWGNRVFSSNHAGKGWDGSYQGKPAEMGVYHFMIDYAIGTKQFNEKGDVTLVR